MNYYKREVQFGDRTFHMLPKIPKDSSRLSWNENGATTDSNAVPNTTYKITKDYEPKSPPMLPAAASYWNGFGIFGEFFSLSRFLQALGDI